MTDLTRLISRLDDLTRQLADLEAEHKALREDHRLLKMKVEEWGSHLELYHVPQEAICGACHGLLEAHRDAICTKCTQRLAMKDLQECLDFIVSGNRLTSLDDKQEPIEE